MPFVQNANGQEDQQCGPGHVLMENRHGLVLDTRVMQGTGTAERGAGLAMAEAILGQRQVRSGSDKGYDTRDFVDELRELRVTPHVAQHTTGRSSAIDGRTTRHPCDGVSQRKRTCVEEIFNWLKTMGRPWKTRHRWEARGAGCSPLRQPYTTWYGCARWQQRHDPRADRNVRPLLHLPALTQTESSQPCDAPKILA
jgi:hypothetical protein